MLFNSIPFLVFLLVFYPSWRLLPQRLRNSWMLLGSYFFYGWWDWRFCGLLALSTVVDWFIGAALHRGGDSRRRRLLLVMSLVTNLSILGCFKYCNFFLQSTCDLLGAIGFSCSVPVLEIVLPVGISFYTFQTLSYTIDIYRGTFRPVRSFIDFALFVSFFPQLVAGPIERASRLLPQLVGGTMVRSGDLASGMRLILMGMIYKVLIGDQLAPVVEEAFAAPGDCSASGLWRGAVFFALQIYCDFCGYSKIARGTARLFGVDVMVNFRQPYLALNITDFWRRWHISLSRWLRDYLYIPLGGNRCGRRRVYMNLLITMVLGGLWHGANWTFVVWGGLHGLYLAGHKLWLRGREPDCRIAGRGGLSLLLVIMRITVTFGLVLLAWVFFRASDFATAFAFLGGMVDGSGGWLGGELLILVGVLGLVGCIDGLLYGLDREELVTLIPRPIRPGVVAGLWVVVISHFIFSGEVPFIYFSF